MSRTARTLPGPSISTTSRRAAALACACVAIATALWSSSCTILWAFNATEEGLPCGPVDAPPRCLDGYACVDDVCVKAAFLQAGEECADTAQCEAGLFCGNAFSTCSGDDADDLNCALRGDDNDLRCRATCDPRSGPTGCSGGERCFTVVDVPGVAGFCQAGTCATDSDCGVVQGSPGLCADVQSAGNAGLCLERCDPLTCASGHCAGCDGLDDVADEQRNCVPMPGEVLSSRTICDATGGLREGDECATSDDLCELGTFCVSVSATAPATCARWCRVGGGNPACNVGSCVPIDGTIGFCAQ